MSAVKHVPDAAALRDEAADALAGRREIRRIGALFAPYRGRLSVVLAMIVASAALGMVSPFLLRAVIDDAIPNRDSTLLLELVGGMMSIAVVMGVLGVGQTWLSNLVGQCVMHDLRSGVFRHLQRLSLAFFTRTRVGEVQSRIANDIGGVQNVVTNTATSVAANATTLIATIAAMVVLDPRLAALSLGVFPVVAIISRSVGERRKAITHTKQDTMADISSLVEESLSISGVLLGKTLARGEDLANRFSAESERLAELEVRGRMTGRWALAAVQTGFMALPALVYLFAGLNPDSVSIGTVVAFTMLQTRLFSPLGQLIGVVVEIQMSFALFHRIFEYLDQPVDIFEGKRELCDVRGDVSLDGVSFRYGDKWTLRDIDLAVPAGSKTAIVGETGSGKTTLGYLAARLYDAERGAVRIDGVDTRELTFASLADAVGMVSQETYLFHASVRENLRFARPEASDEDVEAAARAARIHDVIAELPDGYETVVGERGFRFSGGERQRIGIARTILRNPPVLILDEATSALDVQTERAVDEALAELAAGRTTIVIAHRLSTVRDADQIVVLERGQVVECGTHAGLLARGGRYAAMVARDAAGDVELLAA